MTKELPIGIDNFPNIIRNNCYYVDKTKYIKTVLNPGIQVLLITRPRRFGKSLFINTVKSFLQIDPKNPGDDTVNAELFKGLEITKDTDFCNKYMGQVPCITLSLKDIEGSDFERAYAKFALKMQAVIGQYEFLVASPKLSSTDKAILERYLEPDFLRDQKNIDDAQNFLKNLIVWVSKHYERRVAVLIDEYDVPLAKAAQFGYYDKMLELIRAFLGQALKEDPLSGRVDETYLLKAILTGCLRVSKESLFTGLNNLSINTVLSQDSTLSEVIGFSSQETFDLLKYYNLNNREQDVKHWYDGYRFANSEMYCPWDVINFCYQASSSAHPDEYQPENYWDGMGGTSVIQEFLGFLSSDDADRMQILVDGKEVPLTINDKLTYSDFTHHKSQDFWTLLLFTGYLTVVKRLSSINTYLVRIPNEEIRDAFIRNIKERFSAANGEFVQYGHKFAKAALSGNTDEMCDVLAKLLVRYVSVRDTATKAPAENYYHGFLTSKFFPDHT